MRNDPLVSVIIPTYNRAAKVQVAIDSVLQQEYNNIQIVVIDDGSKDDTREAMRKYGDTSNLEYHYKSNGGQASARNMGFSFSKGTIIASLDSDDKWSPQFLSRMVAKLESENLDFVFSNWYQGTKDNKWLDFLESYEDLWPFFDNKKDGWVDLSYEAIRKVYIKGCPSPSSSFVVRKSSVFSAWNNELKIGDDWFFLLNIILNKQCKAAFTLDKLWYKDLDDINVYDGRKRVEVLKNLYIDDLKIFMENFSNQLSKNELDVLEKMHIGALVRYAKYSLLKKYNLGAFSTSLWQSFFMKPGFTLKSISSDALNINKNR
jgi:glycosyltransferase involved in cell wall biosynthesis